MPGTSLIISNEGRQSGALLQQYLTERGVYDPSSPAVVFYGFPHSRPKHNLNGNRNARPGRGKVGGMEQMEAYGVRTVPWAPAARAYELTSFPLLARQTHGMGGEGIVPVFQPEEVPWRIRAGWTWFSEYVPTEMELRVWVWRGEEIDTYEKRMTRPGDYKRIGRNFDNGFDFIKVPTHKGALTQAVLACEAIGLDFSAVDVLIGKDGLAYVLETNTAPGVLKSHTEGTLSKLADRIEGWVVGGYPDRGN